MKVTSFPGIAPVAEALDQLVVESRVFDSKGKGNLVWVIQPSPTGVCDVTCMIVAMEDYIFFLRLDVHAVLFARIVFSVASVRARWVAIIFYGGIWNCIWILF